MTIATTPIISDLRRQYSSDIMPPRLRGMLEFAEAEFVIPEGPYAGRKFRRDRQPWARLWFEAIDSGRWNRAAAVGPTQSGKTTVAFLVPLLYYLFELRETVICGVADLAMARDKWKDDIEPAIKASPFARDLPTAGQGSKGGDYVQAIHFRNGATLRFMTAGGGDKARAAKSTRVLIMTEVDGFDRPGASSRETDKVGQLKARTLAHGSAARIFEECTASIETGEIWQAYQQGTASRILLPCPHCATLVSPEREHFLGWQDAPDLATAKERGRFHCPECGQAWDDRERMEANRRARMIHRGQELTPDGGIVGQPIATDTFGFRWSAVNNLFLDSATIAAWEWQSARKTDPQDAERFMLQFIWAKPWLPPKPEIAPLAPELVTRRVAKFRKGFVPPATHCITLGVDIGKRLGHWVALASRADGGGHILDYGRFEIASDDLGEKVATLSALRDFRELIAPGWPMGEQTIAAQLVLVDVGWAETADAIYGFCREPASRQFRPSLGHGTTKRDRWYRRPNRVTTTHRRIGDGWYGEWIPVERLERLHVDVDLWKTRLHSALTRPAEREGAITIYEGTTHNEHLTLAHHLTAEQEVVEFVPGRGEVRKWQTIRRGNHFLDAGVLAMAAANACGARTRATDEMPRSGRSLREFFTQREREQ